MNKLEKQSSPVAADLGSRSRRRRSLRRTWRRGGVMVEAAFVLPLCLLLILGVFEYGRYLFILQLCHHSAREGARYAVTHTQPVVISGVTYGNATSDVTNLVTSMLAGQTLASQSIQVYAADSLGNNIGNWTTIQTGECVCVQITGNYQTAVTSLLSLPSSIPVNVKVVMRAEGN